MKNLSIVLNVVLLLAVAVLYILFFSKHSNDAGGRSPRILSGEETKIVYINTDSLLSKYSLAVELTEEFLKKQDDRNADLNLLAKELDQMYTDFQRKYQNGVYLTQERSDAAQQEILRKRDDFEKYGQQLKEQSIQDQIELNKRLYEEIVAYLKEFNRSGEYNIVLSTIVGGTVLYAEEGYDITDEVVKGLNAKYKKAAR